MLRATPLLIGALAAGAAGCQTFVGIEDVSGHLPFIDGDYMVTIRRVRTDQVNSDQIRLRGTALLDPDERTAALSLDMLSTSDSTLSEVNITDLFFPDDAAEAVFQLSLNIPDAAVDNPPLPQADQRIDAEMLFIVEGEYSFCAVPLNGDLRPSFGSILLTSSDGTVVTPDFDCDLR